MKHCDKLLLLLVRACARELTLSTEIDSSSVLPPADALAGDTPVSDGDAAVTADVLHVGAAVWVVRTRRDWSSGSPEGLAAVQVLLVLLENLAGVGRGNRCEQDTLGERGGGGEWV